MLLEVDMYMQRNEFRALLSQKLSQVVLKNFYDMLPLLEKVWRKGNHSYIIGMKIAIASLETSKFIARNMWAGSSSKDNPKGNGSAVVVSVLPCPLPHY